MALIVLCVFMCSLRLAGAKTGGSVIRREALAVDFRGVLSGSPLEEAAPHPVSVDDAGKSLTGKSDDVEFSVTNLSMPVPAGSPEDPVPSSANLDEVGQSKRITQIGMDALPPVYTYKYQHNGILRFGGTKTRTTLPLSVTVSGNAPRTVGMWAKTSLRKRQQLFSSGTPRRGQAFNLVIGSRHTHVWSPMKLGFMGYDADYWPSPRVTTVDGRWHHYAVSYDGATIRLYVDGKPSGSKKIALNTQGACNYLAESNHRAYVCPFVGEMKQVFVIGAALPSASIYNIYAGAQSMAEEALNKAKKSLAQAQAARAQSTAALKEARKSLVAMGKHHRLIVTAQRRAETAHQQAKLGKKKSSDALKRASTASKDAHESLNEAKKADDHATKLEGVVRTQDHTLHSLGHTMKSLNATMAQVESMQKVDEEVLKVTNMTTRHLEINIHQHNKTLNTIEAMQEFDHHSYKAINSTIETIQHSLGLATEMVSQHGNDIVDAKKKQEELSTELEQEKKELEQEKKEVRQQQEQMKSQQKALRITVISALSALLLYLLPGLLKKAGMAAAAELVGRLMTAYMARSEFTITVQRFDGMTLFGPKTMTGDTPLGEVIAQMKQPPAGHLWKVVSANVALDPETRMYELGEGRAFVLTASHAEHVACSPAMGALADAGSAGPIAGASGCAGAGAAANDSAAPPAEAANGRPPER
ncbi:unnamed protein product [Prorocentrum cordatum]|uniref:LamG-like jellyroll fold domain-containing protein n=1 Tax=Prorocentrum cordatum TaxID=2364126 RepID=A0ABN9WUV3_9DINO|nr:unnamed protein product [Polarella glacialis]